MTIAALSERLGIPTRTLFRYRRSRDRNGTESSAEDQNGEFSPAIERREADHPAASRQRGTPHVARSATPKHGND